MAEFLTDPSVLTKDKLKSALVANNVSLPNGEQKKGVYVELYLKKLTSQNKTNTEVFSSDEEPPAARSGRKATRKTDRVRPEEIDVTELSNEDLKDQLQKYGVNAGPIVASTRKVYEKKLQKLLDLGPPQTTFITSSEQIQTNNSRNGNTDSDQYSDKEEETTAAEPEPEPEPEPVPVVEAPLRSRGKTPVTARTRSSQQKEEDDVSEEDDVLLNVERRSRRSSRRLDGSVPDPVSETEMLPGLRERERFSAIPKDPMPLIADTLLMSPSVREDGSFESPDCRTASLRAAAERYHGDVSTDKTAEPHQTPSPTWQQGKKFSERVAALPKTSSEEVELSVLDTALLEVGPREVLSSRPGHVGSSQELKSVSSLKRTARPDPPHSASTPPSRDLIHRMRYLSPSPADSPHRPSQDLYVTKSSAGVKERSVGCAAAVQRQTDDFFSPVTPVQGQDCSLRDQTPGGLIEKLSAVEQTPKTTERNVLKDLFPNEVLNTPTGISATRRQPIKGAAGRPFTDPWKDSLRPRLTEHRYTTSSYTESRSAPRVSAAPLSVPLSVPKSTAPPSVPAKARRRVPLWVQLLLLAAVAGFLLFVYQAMESNQMSPFRQPGLENSGK
ncbi:thymopoietin a isoform X2 [Tachysurus vachellii]|uniref:thymopoietin a isoform X2 n=1 Tax=Tachysurus vachellii TaxID=175792 RepID=UPI00296AE467|nr:thymopoietin a isoform X2 [Tachysurus vachellii]